MIGTAPVRVQTMLALASLLPLFSCASVPLAFPRDGEIIVEPDPTPEAIAQSEPVGVEARLGEPGYSASGIRLPAETRPVCTQTLEHRELHRLDKTPLGRRDQLALGLDAAAVSGLLLAGVLWSETEYILPVSLGTAAAIVSLDLIGFGTRMTRNHGSAKSRQSEESVACGPWNPVADSLLPAGPLGQSLIRDEEQAKTLTGVVRSPEEDPLQQWSSEISIDLTPGQEFGDDWK